jgi:hypothetical protein
MNWVVAGLLTGVVAWLVDFVLWTKVFTKGMDQFFTPPPAGQRAAMGPQIAGSLVLAIVFGVVFALVYSHLRGSLWASGIAGGMEFGSILWIGIAFLALGNSVWYDKVRPLMNAVFWAWLIRLNVAGVAVALLVK